MEDNGGHSFTEGMDPVHFKGKEMTKSERLRKIAEADYLVGENYTEVGKFLLSLTDTLDSLEIGDEEIEEWAKTNALTMVDDDDGEYKGTPQYRCVIDGAEWYREQMRNKLK